ncbi:MAG: RNA chaperone Hfq [Nitrospirota bacterium]|nr:RNA chaperone Hfq [Nitrospirota bacterium]
MEANLLDKMLADYQDRKTAVTIVLQNRARVSGTIRSFDSYVIILENSRSEIVYRHAVSSVSPAVSAPQRPATRPQEQPRQTAKEDKRPAARPAARPAKQKHPKPQPRPATPSAEPSLNTGMQEGLQRWLKGQKAK